MSAGARDANDYGLSSSSRRTRSAAPSRSSYCPERSDHRNAASPTTPIRIAKGTRTAEVVHQSVSATAFGENNEEERSRKADGPVFRSRNAFATTSTEDSDIASAAKSGVT